RHADNNGEDTKNRKVHRESHARYVITPDSRVSTVLRKEQEHKKHKRHKRGRLLLCLLCFLCSCSLLKSASSRYCRRSDPPGYSAYPALRAAGSTSSCLWGYGYGVHPSNAPSRRRRGQLAMDHDCAGCRRSSHCRRE